MMTKVQWGAWGVCPPVVLECSEWHHLDSLCQWISETWPAQRRAAEVQTKASLLQWRSSMSTAARSAKWKSISSWLKGRSPIPAYWHNEQAFVHPKAVADLLANEWEKIYGVRAQESDGELFTNPEVAGVPPDAKDEWPLPPLEGSDFYAEIQTKARTAAGSDRLSWQLLRALPRDAWDQVAAVFRGVEAAHSWPSELLDVNLVPIGKAESEGKGLVPPLKARMISVISLPFRLWSSIRAKYLSSSWARAVLPAQIHGGVLGRSMLSASFLESAHWDWAAEMQIPWTVTYLDMTKCYDSLCFRRLALAAGKWGFPKALSAALLSWQTQQKRWVTTRGWTSRPLEPAHGLAQGCPMSFFSLRCGPLAG